MKISIIPSAGIVLVNGVPRSITLDDLDGIRAIQWRTGKGHVEYMDDRINSEFDHIEIIQPYYDAWVAAVPPPPTLDELKDLKERDYKDEAIRRVENDMPEWANEQTMSIVTSLWTLLSPNKTGPMHKAKAQWDHAKTRGAEARGKGTAAGLAQMDPETDDGWPP